MFCTVRKVCTGLFVGESGNSGSSERALCAADHRTEAYRMIEVTAHADQDDKIQKGISFRNPAYDVIGWEMDARRGAIENRGVGG